MSSGEPKNSLPFFDKIMRRTEPLWANFIREVNTLKISSIRKNAR